MLFADYSISVCIFLLKCTHTKSINYCVKIINLFLNAIVRVRVYHIIALKTLNMCFQHICCAYNKHFN